jgi:pyocin large subunit-like protein
VNRVFLVTAAAIVGAGLLWFHSPPHAKKPEVTGASPAEQINAQRVLSHGEILRSWGNPASLPDHFARHGRDFGARNADEYAVLAYEFLHRASVEPYRAKIDNHQVLRIYDPRTGSFGAYNPDGTTKTFFKPGRAGYFDRQPGRAIDLRNPR